MTAFERHLGRPLSEMEESHIEAHAKYLGDKDVQWSLFAASSLIVSVPVMALFYTLEKHLVGGLTAGGAKG